MEITFISYGDYIYILFFASICINRIVEIELNIVIFVIDFLDQEWIS